jgi:hypothetical protein
MIDNTFDIYIITLKDSGHFYIGASGNSKYRKKCHLDSIKSVIIQMHWHDQWHKYQKTKPVPEFTTKIGSHVHRFIAAYIKDKVPKNSMVIGMHISKHYTFSIIHSFPTLEKAKAKEQQMLKKEKNNPMCLNKTFSSGFSGAHIPIKYRPN